MFLSYIEKFTKCVYIYNSVFCGWLFSDHVVVEMCVIEIYYTFFQPRVVTCILPTMFLWSQCSMIGNPDPQHPFEGNTTHIYIVTSFSVAFPQLYYNIMARQCATMGLHFVYVTFVTLQVDLEKKSSSVGYLNKNA